MDAPNPLQSRVFEIPEPDPPINLKPFLRALPDWIYKDPAYRTLDGGQRWVLHVMAGWARNEHVVSEGSILVVCGEIAVAKMGVSRSTFWRYVKVFMKCGFVRVIGRGGGRTANTFCIPGARGVADHLSVNRRGTIRGKGGSRPQAPSLVCQTATRALVSQPETGGVSASNGSRRNGRRQLVSQDESHPSKKPSTIDHHHDPGDAGAEGPTTLPRQERRCELKLLGINGTTLSEMTEDTMLHPVIIRLFVAQGQERGVESLAGWVISQWRKGSHRKLTHLDPRDVSLLTRHGHLRSICGLPVEGKVLQNASFVVVRKSNGQEVEIAREKLVPDALTLIDPPSSINHVTSPAN